MSFLKINDPLKRDAIVKEYLELKNRIRGNLLSERIGESQLQTDLSKFYRPITETQKATTREITEGLRPISEGLENIRRDVRDIPGTISSEIAIKKYEKELEEEEKKKKELAEKAEEERKYIPSPETLGETAYNYLHGKEYKNIDVSFGIHLGDNGKYYMGAQKSPHSDRYRLNAGKMLTIGYNNIYVDGEKFTGTPGLWELIMKAEPDSEIYKQNDLKEYGKLLIKTNALHHDFNPNNPHPRSSGGHKWDKILSPIWKEIKEKMKEEKEAAKKTAGKGVVVISSDPNALLERLDLLLASQEAGHTGVRNELVSICDELKRQGVLDTNAYKKLNHIIKK